MKSNKLSLVLLDILASLGFSCMITSIPIIILSKKSNSVTLMVAFFCALVIIATPIGLLLWKKIKVLLWKLSIKGQYICYETIDNKITIDIDKTAYTKVNKNDRYYYVTFYYLNGTEFYLDKITHRAFKFIKNSTDIIIDDPANETEEKKKKASKGVIKSLLESIVKYKVQIITSIIGLVISVSSILLYVNNKDNTAILVLCIIVCFVYGVFEIYYSWIKNNKEIKDTFSKLVCSFLFTLFYHVIVFGAISILLSVIGPKPFSIEFLYYTIFSYPSFVIVIGILLLILAGASYA